MSAPDEELLTAGAIRAMGFFVPMVVADDVRMRMTRRLDAGDETLHVEIDAYQDACFGRIQMTVKVGP